MAGKVWEQEYIIIVGENRKLDYHLLHAFLSVHADCVIRAELCSQKTFHSDA